MVSAELARNILGIIGNVISFFLFASPMPTFVTICKKKSVEQFKPDPYIATAMNCMLWVFYGLPIVRHDSIPVVTINGTGLILELIYLTIFFIYAEKKVVTCTLMSRKTHEQRSTLVGILCVIFGVLTYASPLTVMIGNGLGAVFGAVQLILYACYYKTSHRDEKDVKPTADSETQTELQLPTSSGKLS